MTDRTVICAIIASFANVAIIALVWWGATYFLTPDPGGGAPIGVKTGEGTGTVIVRYTDDAPEVIKTKPLDLSGNTVTYNFTTAGALVCSSGGCVGKRRYHRIGRID